MVDLAQDALRIIIGVALILALPGFAMTAALFSPGTIGVAERIAFSLGLSLALPIVIALGLARTSVALEARTWLAGSLAVTLFASAVALVRWHRHGGSVIRWPALGLGAPQVILLGLSVALAVGAIGVARRGAEEQPYAGFTEAWVLSEGASGGLRIGIRSEERQPVRYVVRMVYRATIRREWTTPTLLPGDEWSEPSSVPEVCTDEIPTRIEILIYRTDQPAAVYRRVWLDAAAASCAAASPVASQFSAGGVVVGCQGNRPRMREGRSPDRPGCPGAGRVVAREVGVLVDEDAHLFRRRLALAVLRGDRLHGGRLAGATAT